MVLVTDLPLKSPWLCPHFSVGALSYVALLFLTNGHVRRGATERLRVL